MENRKLTAQLADADQQVTIVIYVSDGGFEHGFRGRFDILNGGSVVAGHRDLRLPPLPALPALYQTWRDAYLQMGLGPDATLLMAPIQAVQNQTTHSSVTTDCAQATRKLEALLKGWFSQQEFTILEALIKGEVTRYAEQAIPVIFDFDTGNRVTNEQLRKLPWHQWNLLRSTLPQAEVVLSTGSYHQVQPLTRPANVLVILGNSEGGLSLEKDKQAWEALKHQGAELTIVEQPSLEMLDRQLRSHPWDILFFAGHSSSQQDTLSDGYLQISDTETIQLEVLDESLQRSVQQGLKLAIFNSCDGLGLANFLARLAVPFSIVMREPVPDVIAREFLKIFLDEFSQGKSLYLAMREARSRLKWRQGDPKQSYPCATWLPILCQSPTQPALSWPVDSPAAPAPAIPPGVSTATPSRFPAKLAAVVGAVVTIGAAMLTWGLIQQQLQPPTAPIENQSPQQPPKSLDELARDLWQDHQVSFILAGLALGSYWGVLWVKPLWLLKIPSSNLPVPWTSWKLPLAVLRPLKYRNRVLDAWVNQHWQTAEAEFLKCTTVENRGIHISLPVRLNKTVINDLHAEQLTSTFQRKPAVLLITGEGGAGKTSLACQLAQWGLRKQLSPHRMLPVLIETELDHQTTLLESIRGLVSALTYQSDPISSELLEKLLQRQRILVIVDHFSEMGETVRAQVRPELADFPAKALIITSRLDESLGGVPKTVLTPMQIEANRLWPFMSTYLEAKGKQGLFEDDEYANGCDRLRRMAGEHSITVLLARLYIDHMIQEQEGAGGILPDSVPRLMLSYLNQLNRTIEPSNKQDDLIVQQDAKTIAWECLRQTYRPTSVKKLDAIVALDNINNRIDAKARLDYLEKRLQFLQAPEPGDRIRIILDPLAEYLAALYLLERNCQADNPTEAWRDFLLDVDQTLEHTTETPNIVRGFLLAVRDCCLDSANEKGVPQQLAAHLARKAGLDPEELQKAQEKRRIRRLISDLSEPELKDRLRAATELGNYGAIAKIAKPNLVGMLENRNQTPVARQAAAKALGRLGLGHEELLNLLTNTAEDAVVRASAAEALAVLNIGHTDLRLVLENREQPLPVRQGAARALRLLEANSGHPIPMLVVELTAHQISTKVIEIPIWQCLLRKDTPLDLVAIPAGEFMMGSAPGEEGRDVYASIYPDTIGKDMEAQHRVQLPTFWMSQFPINQAQWKAVAALPKIERDLEIEPSAFKGDDRPVEEVSWYDAVEFCQRLSQHTGQTYRLPSEAEWEYACRAWTTSPFHLGDTLAVELANYNGNHTYGPGVVGEYRRQTTPCGALGIVNNFGLSDMHGNVLEWCLDHWHPGYEGAPDDGSAWLSNKESTRRIVRGGSWFLNPQSCRAAYRNVVSPEGRSSYIGFRVVTEIVHPADNSE